MENSILRRLIVSIACLLVLGVVGCDDARMRGLDGEGAAHDDGTSPEHEEQAAHQPMDDQGHGISDDEQEHVEPGFMNGSWRAATGEQDKPVAYFDTFQDKGSADVSGSFVMGLAPYERFDGESGSLQAASFDGEKLTVRWNPTSDTEEVYTLEATRVDEDTFEGRVTGKRNIELDLPVTLTRRGIDR